MGVQWGRRVLTGLVGIPAALRLLASPRGMVLLATGLCCLCLAEFSGAIAPRVVAAVAAGSGRRPSADADSPAHRALLVAAGGASCLAAATGRPDASDLAMFAAFLALAGFHLARVPSTAALQAALVALLLDAFAIGFVVGGFVRAILLRSAGGDFGLGLQILGLCCSWACDTGALVAGSALGAAKLAPAVSPGKTLLGAAAGVASSAATALALFALPRHVAALDSLLPPPEVVSPAAQAWLGLLLGALCVLGDLLESLLKRVAGVKDSGAFFPGHGGCLDRMDSFLLVAPGLYYCARFLW